MKRATIKFSVVVPLYNKIGQIRSTLQSALDQQYENYEIIVIDDGSTDGSADIVEEMILDDSRIRLIRQENAHVSATRNNGIKAAEGEYIAFLDADDIWLENHLTEMNDLAETFPQAGMLGTSYWRRRTSKPDFGGVAAQFEGSSGLIDDYFKWASEYQFIYTSSIAIRRDVFETVGYFDEKEKRFSEDIAQWARVAAHYSVAYSGKFTVIYRCDVPGQATSLGIERGLSTRLGKSFHKLLKNTDANLNRYSLQKYCDTAIYRRIRLMLRSINFDQKRYKDFIETSEVVEWAKNPMLRALLFLPLPLLWKPIFLFQKIFESRIIKLLFSSKFSRYGIKYRSHSN